MADVEYVTQWECPDKNGAPILVMPNVPRPLHGKGMQPRTIYGSTVWNFMRKKAYMNANYKCEICGCEPTKGNLHAHELFRYDYLKQEGEFVRVVAICRDCHNFIHSGRLQSLYKRKNPLCPKKYLLHVVEHGFKIVYEYNKQHDNKLRVYSTIKDYMRDPSLKDEISELIDKYEIEFYEEHIPKRLRWKGWHVIVDGKRYNSPFNSQSDWERAMIEMDMKDTVRTVQDPFKGKGFDMINEILKEAEVAEKIAGCKSGSRISKKASK